MNRRRSKTATPSRGVRIALISAALVLFVAGLYFGVQLAKPPPPPDFAALEAAPPSLHEASSHGPDLDREPRPVDPLAVLSTGAAKKPDRRPEVVDGATPAMAPGGPRIALVIDDLGRSLRDLDVLAQLGVPISYAVLPFESQTAEVVATLRERGEEILCHIPMQAKGGNNPGPGALLSDMSVEQLQAATARALAAVPGAVGVNNHMGSSIASDPQAIAAVMQVVAKSNLFFLDSRTSADTLAYTTARRLGLPAGERQVFLDTEIESEAIAAQFDRLLALAQQRGSAIAIAHPHDITLRLLAERVPQAQAAGYEFVLASTLMDR